MRESIKLGVREDLKELTYISMYKQLEDIGSVNEQTFRGVFNGVSFKDVVGIMYNGLPIQVGWAYIPVISDGILEVKLLKLEQGENIAIVLPENIAEGYKQLEEDPSKLKFINSRVSLIGDSYGFETDDKELQELIIKLYTTTNNGSTAFRLTKEVDTKEEGTEETDNMFGDKGASPSLDGNLDDNIPFSPADTPEESFEDIPELGMNESAYREFKRYDNSLNVLINNLYKNVPKTIREHITASFYGDDKALVVKVDNKAIYDLFNKVPKHARKLLTQIGETLRLNEDTQLVDSIMFNNKRLFVLTENNSSNLWVVEKEPVEVLVENRKTKTIVPNNQDIITLKRSSIIQENRAYKPRKYNNLTVFVGDK